LNIYASLTDYTSNECKNGDGRTSIHQDRRANR